MACKWKKIDLLENPPVRLRTGDECYYARDYVSGGKYNSSEANQLIQNFKKHPNTRGTPQWKYKERACYQFATELTTLLPDECTVMFIPSSKTDNDNEYDPRFDILARYLQRMRPSITVESPISRSESCLAAHHGGDRTVNGIRSTLSWDGFEGVPDTIILIDDVITAGSHFKACQQMILAEHPDVKVIGVFWARTVWPEAVA